LLYSIIIIGLFQGGITLYIAVTGLKPKGYIGLIRFFLVAMPAFNAAQKANGCLFCEKKALSGHYYTLTAWKNKDYMRQYKESRAHSRAQKLFPKIAYGKVYVYESISIPTWSDALEKFHNYARSV
jgi:hypothetical protein